ncbi:MAG: hypothetical protein WA240_08585 [Nitrospirota bacterium]
MLAVRPVFVIIVFFGLSFFCLASEERPVMNVVIDKNAIKIPVGTILIARKGDEYCAVKLLTAVEVEAPDEAKKKGAWKANYQSYYQNDKSGSFINQNAKVDKGELVLRQPVGIGHLTSMSRSNTTIFCGTVFGGNIKLKWSGLEGAGWIYFDERGRTIALAPTKWADITEVNFLDPMLKWYQYDEKRKKIEIPLEKLW